MTTGRSVRLRYYVYKMTMTMGPYVPVSVLYLLDEGYSVGFVALVQAVFSLSLLAAELPTGYVGDRIGRRWTLVAGSGFRVAGVVGYVLVDSAGGYLFLKVLAGTGWAFRSGTLDAWLYELLATYDDPDEFARVSGRGRTALLATSAVGAIVGGVLYGIDPAFPFLLTGAIGSLSAPILLTFPRADRTTVEQESGDDADVPDDSAFSMTDAVEMLKLQVRRPSVRWIVAYSMLIGLVFDLSRTFEQPALDSVGVSVAGMGVLYAAFKLVSAGAASTTGWLTDTLGVKRTLALAVPVLGMAYAAIAVVPLAVVPALFLYRSGRSVFTPIRNQYLNDQLGDVGRATVLSGASMILSLAGVVARLVGGEIATIVGPVTFLAGAGAGLAVAAGALWLLVSPVRPTVNEPSRPAAAD
jgi:MFS family permease